MYWYFKVHHHQYSFALDIILFRAEPPSYSAYLPLYKHCECKLAIASKARNSYSLCWQYDFFLLSKDYDALLSAVMYR